MDKTDLKAILKEQGLDLAEETVTTIVKGVLKALPSIVKATETPIDDMIVLPLLSVMEPVLMSYIDKIDGKEG